MNTPHILIRTMILFVVVMNNPKTSFSEKNDDFCITDLRAITKQTKVRLTWTHNGIGTEYRIERSEINASEGFNEIDVIQTKSGTYVDKNIVIKRDYWYRIIDSRGCASTPVHVFFPTRRFNHSPSIESTPLKNAQINVTYIYDAIGLDPEKKNLTWKLDVAPAGMSINTKNGTISWTPTAEFKDSMVCVLVRTTDESGVSDQQFFTIHVNGQTRKTSCHTFFGPIHFKSNDIFQKKFYNELSVPPWIVPPYELHIFNGNPDGTHRISSAIIEINGIQIMSLNGMNQIMAKKSYSVNLKRLNSMNTTLVGNENSFLSLYVCGAVGDLTPPQITVITPASGSIIKKSTPTISIRYEDIARVGESSASGINTSSLKVIINNKDYTEIFKADTYGASASFPESLALTKGDHVLFAAVKDNADNLTSKTINFTCVPNLPPVANRDKYETIENTSLIIRAPGVLKNDKDLNGDNLIAEVVDYPQHGSMVFNYNGSFTYTPDRDFSGNDVFHYIALDSLNNSNISSASIEIVPGPKDLQPVSVDVSDVSVDAQTLKINGSVTVKIANTGTSNVVFPFNVIVFEDINANGLFESITDKIVGYELVNGLLSQQEDTFDIPVTGSSLFKGNIIHVFVDNTNEIDETNENNNILHSMNNCGYKPPIEKFSPIVEWKWTGSPQSPEWNRVMSQPVVINLNDDNNNGTIGMDDIPDIVFHCFKSNNFQKDGVLRAISGNGKKELFTISDFNICPWSNPAAADIDMDNKPEIITYGFISDNICIIAFENNGDFKWSYKIMPVSIWSGKDWSIAIADIEGDAEVEVIAGNIVLDASGREKWRGPDQNESKMTSTIADIDRDGKMEVISDGTVYDELGKIIWSNIRFENGYSAVGNFDNDEFAEIIIVVEGMAYLVEHSGEIIWGPVDINTAVTDGNQDHSELPTIADFNGDLKPEIGIEGKNSYTVLNGDGSVNWKIPAPDQPLNITGTSVFDFEGNGTAELVYTDEQYLKICRGSDGKVLFEYKLSQVTRFESPLIIDIDNDHNAEIVALNNSFDFGGASGITVIGDANQTWINTRKIWNQRAFSLSNVDENGSIPTNPDPSWLVHNTFRYNFSKDALACIDLTSSYVQKKGNKFIIRIGNGGALNIPSSLNVAYYMGDPDINGRLLGVKHTTKQLNPGQYEDIVLTRIPVLKPGQYSIYVVADDNGKGKGQYREINEDNNKIVFRFSVNN